MRHRTILLATAAAALALTTAVTVTVTPAADAADWTTPHVLTADNSGFGEVRAVGTGTAGGAVALWVDDDTGAGRVRTATAVAGQWGESSYLSAAGVETKRTVLAASDSDHVAAAWLEQSGDTWRLRAARQQPGGGWTVSGILSGAAPVALDNPAITVDGAGTVHVGFVAEVDGKQTLQLRTWRPGQSPVSAVLAADDATTPALDANEAGDALLTFTLDQTTDSVHAVEFDADAQAWGEVMQVSFLGRSSYQGVGALDATGRSTIAFTARGNDADWRMHVVSEKPDGTGFGVPAAVSPVGTHSYAPSIAVDATGRALLAWRYQHDGAASVRYLQRSGADQAWVGPVTLAAVDQYTRPQAVAADAGAQLIDLVTDGTHRTWWRTAATEAFELRDFGTGFVSSVSDTDAHLDSAGRGVVIEAWSAQQGLDEIRTRFLDVAGPTTTLDPLQPTTLTSALSVGWTATDDLSAIDGSDLLVRAAAWDEPGFGPTNELVVGGSGPVLHDLGPGTTYCYTARSTDSAGNVGADSAERCTATPVDDATLKGKKWKRTTAPSRYLGTLTSTSTKGRTLSLGGVDARRLALVVVKAPKGGRVTVSLGKQELRTVGLRGTGRKVVPIATFPEVRSGTVRIKVVSRTGRPVRIDGLVAAH